MAEPWRPSALAYPRVWDCDSKQLRCELSVRANAFLTWSPDNKTLAVGQNGEVWLCDVASRQGTRRITPQQMGITAVAWSPDGTKLAVKQPVNPGAGMQILEAATGRSVHFFPGNFRLTPSGHPTAGA